MNNSLDETQWLIFVEGAPSRPNIVQQLPIAHLVRAQRVRLGTPYQFLNQVTFPLHPRRLDADLMQGERGQISAIIDESFDADAAFVGVHGVVAGANQQLEHHATALRLREEVFAVVRVQKAVKQI